MNKFKIFKNYLKRKILIDLLKKYFRPSSYPFLTGDTLRNNADIIYDETNRKIPKKIENNDLIFVKSNYLKFFFENIHPDIDKTYRLVTHNSDLTISSDFKKYIDNKVTSWHAQNLDFEMNSIVKPLPIGFENKRYLNNGVISSLNRDNLKKDFFILSCFNNKTHAERTEVEKIYLNNKLVTNKKNISNKEYIQNLSSHMFSVCPRGNGLDTHRLWESIYLKTIPILLRNNFSLNFYNLNLPVLLIDNWSEINNFSKSDLSDIYKKHELSFKENNYNSVSYWIDI